MHWWVKLNRSIFVNWPGSQNTCTYVRSAILVNARSERHFETQSGYFGKCQISLNTEKFIILPTFFCKSGGLRQWWCYLGICDKIAVLPKLFWRDIIIIKYGCGLSGAESSLSPFFWTLAVRFDRKARYQRAKEIGWSLDDATSEFDLEGDLVGVPHTWCLSAKSFIRLLKLVSREYDIVAMNEWKKSVCRGHEFANAL